MKIGPNDPCHCGSGKKLKKCCVVAIRRVKINTPGRLIARQIYKLWENTVGDCSGMLADLELGQQLVREFTESQLNPTLENLVVIGEPLKIDRKVIPPILSKNSLIQQFIRR